MKNIPNILSISRFPLSVSLLFLTGNPILFVSVYCVTGITDVLDGFLARRYHWESEFGAKIDGFADIVFMLSILVSAFLIKRLQPAFYVYIGIAIIALLKIMNLIFTKIKFKQWSTMHTLANKYTAFPFFVLVPVCMLLERIPNVFVMVLLGTVLIAGLEETVILTRLKEYDADTKSIFHIKNKENKEDKERANV